MIKTLLLYFRHPIIATDVEIRLLLWRLMKIKGLNSFFFFIIIIIIYLLIKTSLQFDPA